MELLMATSLPPAVKPGPMDWTIADVQERLDGIPAERIRTFPAPGTATEEEMRRKVREYFQAGARRIWTVDPGSRTAKVYTSPRRFRLVDENRPLDAGDLLPGFALSLNDWFSGAGRRTRRRKKG
jgi:hypothetical protein